MLLLPLALLLIPTLAACSAISPSPASLGESRIVSSTAKATPAIQKTLSELSPSPLPTAGPLAKHLDLREILVDPAAPQVPAEHLSMTTFWVETTLPGGLTTWVEVVFTQTFPAVPDQLPTPIAGEIGLGTLTAKSGAVQTRAVDNAADGRKNGLERWVGAAVVAMCVAVLVP